MRLIFVCMFFLFSAGCICFGGEVESVSTASREAGKVAVFMRQSKSIELLSETIEGDVLVCADINGRIRWQTFSPYESILIFDGKELSQYEKLSGGWKKLSAHSRESVKKIISEISKLVVGDYSSYEVYKSGGKIFLTPKDGFAKKVLKSILLVPSGDGKTVKSIEFTDSNGDKTVLTVLKIVENPKNFDSAFTEVFNFKVGEK